MISEVIQTGADILLVPRPRRFGKTLNLSMLRYFFERHEDEDQRREAEALFNGLAIKEGPEFEKHFAQYPVIFLTFKDIKERDFDSALQEFRMVLSGEVKRHLDSSSEPVSVAELGWILEKIADFDENINFYRKSLKILSEFLHKVYGVPPVILIDEYDTPIHASWQYGYYDEMISFMRGLLSGAFKDNPNIFKGVITGILRVAKESIFSDLNNLGVYTILSVPFSEKFGITEQELQQILEEYHLTQRLTEIDAWYNGYRFGETTIFNPWSILNFIDEKPHRPRPYWANTSSNALVKDLITQGSLEVRENIKRLINGEAIDSVIDENIVFPDLKKKEQYIYSLFFFSGYLKCEKEIMEPRQLRCMLAVPNEEVRYIFENIISGWLTEEFENQKLKTMLNALVAGNIDQFQRLLNEFVITTLSFFDAKGRNPEAVFQAFVLGMLLNLGEEYEISSNRELGYGRYDILVLPKKDRTRAAILMEMKSITGFYKEEPEKAIEQAVKQVSERGYALELEAKGYENVLKIVVVSDGKQVWVRTV
jgi:hypothetical protein